MTTMEAVSRALGVLEGQGVTDALMAPLRLMTRLQVTLRCFHAVPLYSVLWCIPCCLLGAGR